MTDTKIPKDYETYTDFIKDIHKKLPDEWNTNLDEQGLNQDNTQAGFQRDDSYRFIISVR